MHTLIPRRRRLGTVERPLGPPKELFLYILQVVGQKSGNPMWTPSAHSAGQRILLTIN